MKYSASRFYHHSSTRSIFLKVLFCVESILSFGQVSIADNSIWLCFLCRLHWSSVLKISKIFKSWNTNLKRKLVTAIVSTRMLILWQNAICLVEENYYKSQLANVFVELKGRSDNTYLFVPKNTPTPVLVDRADFIKVFWYCILNVKIDRVKDNYVAWKIDVQCIFKSRHAYWSLSCPKNTHTRWQRQPVNTCRCIVVMKLVWPDFVKHNIFKRGFSVFRLHEIEAIHDGDEKTRRRIFVQDSTLLLPSCIGSKYQCIQTWDRAKNLHTPGQWKVILQFSCVRLWD